MGGGAGVRGENVWAGGQFQGRDRKSPRAGVCVGFLVFTLFAREADMGLTGMVRGRPR
jgi:hypothetical protein